MQAVERTGEVIVSAEVTGPIKLAASETIGHHLIAPALPRFFARYPQARVELIVSRNLADLARREADLAVRLINPETHEHGADYIAQRAGNVRFGVYATPTALAGANGGWQDLGYVSWDESWASQALASWLRQTFAGRPPLLRSNSLEAQYAATRAGVGAALLPRFLGDADPALTLLTEAQLPGQRELWLVYHRDLKASQRVRAMRDFIQQLAVEAGFAQP